MVEIYFAPRNETMVETRTLFGIWKGIETFQTLGGAKWISFIHSTGLSFSLPVQKGNQQKNQNHFGGRSKKDTHPYGFVLLIVSWCFPF